MKNNAGMICAALAALALIGPTLGGLPASQARADGYQVQEDTPARTNAEAITLDGVINQVDSDRDRVTFTADDGHDYTLDTSVADIVLPDSAQPEDVSNLVPGMRLHVNGKRLSGSVIEADRIRILSSDAAPALSPTSSPVDDNGRHIDLRGTVELINKHQDSFVVHINDHTRTIFLGSDTDLIKGNTLEDYPLRPGDRVTVSGVLHDDGTVRADTIILGRPQGDAAASHELVGRITAQGDQDITIRISSSGREAKVFVPRDVPVTHDGRTLSTDDLAVGDTVRVSGTPDGDDFRADHVTIVPADGDGG